MTDIVSISLYLAIAAVITAVLFGALVVYLWLQQKIQALRQENTQLATTLELERKSAQDKINDMSNTFSALSSQALKENNEAFLKLAQENLRQYQHP
jgi:DNA recombination protein RmuC